MDNQYYTYHLIDPRTNEVFYVGMGKGRRIQFHEFKVRHNQKPNNNGHLFNKIKNIIDSGKDIIYKKILEHVDQKSASNKEINEIKRIGRSDLKLGPLCNLTNGGDGVGHLSEEIEKIRREKLRYKKSSDHRKKLSMALKGKIISEETRKKLKDRTIKNGWFYKIEKHHSNETKKKMSLRKKGKSWEEIYGVEESNRRKENLKNRHKLGLMK